MSLYVVLGALLLGTASSVDAFGRTFTLSWIDFAAVAVAIVGAATAWRRRSLRFDHTLLAYAALIAIVLVQATLRPDAWAIIGASSRFITAALVLFGLSQLAPGRSETDRSWPAPFIAFGVIGGVWATVLMLRGLVAADADTFYEVKNVVVLPIGASNYLAAFLMVAAIIAVVFALRRRWEVGAVLAVVGLIATLSRGALAAFAVALLVAALFAHSWRLVGAATATVVLGAAIFFGVANGATGLIDQPGVEVAVAAAAPGGEAAAPSAPSQETAPAPAPDLNRNGRLVLYEAAWNAFTEQPLLGVGLNRLETVTSLTGPPHVNAHNLELHALASVGILGTLAYLAIWVLLALRLRAGTPGPRRTALIAASTGLFLHAQVEALAFTRGIEVVIALLLVLAGAQAGSRGLREIRLGRRLAPEG